MTVGGRGVHKISVKYIQNSVGKLADTKPVAYPGVLFVGGVQQIQLRTEDRENGDLGAVAP